MPLAYNDFLFRWIEGVSQIGWTLDELKLNAAIVLGILSAASSIGSLLANKKELSGFIYENFVKDIELDQQLLAMYNMVKGEHVETAYEIYLKEKAERERINNR
jgi:hypothetical protein